MLHFLSRFSLATRIYSGFLLLGIYVVSVCFLSVFAVGYVHREYMKANSVIESTRQFSALENGLFDLNRSLYFFALKGTDDEKARVEEAFRFLEEKNKEMESRLDNPEIQEKYRRILSSLIDKYRTDMTELFSLQEKSVEAGEKVNRLAEKASRHLNTLIEETTLPSASFALNGLREELDSVLRSIEAASSENGGDGGKQLIADFAALKKAQNVAKQAEMINTKQLKALFSFFNSLEEETNRKLKIDQTLREKKNTVSVTGDQNAKDLKDLISSVALTSSQMLTQAEVGKISLQKIFVFAAAFGGVLAVLLSFLSLFGVRYPLARLIENAQEMARGERAVLIHFTEREDEVGALAKALAVLLVRLKDSPLLSNDYLNNRQNVTYGSSMAYSSFGTEVEKSGGDELYFGQGAGVDMESQLRQILYLMQHINDAAARMTQNVRQSVSDFRDRLEKFAEIEKNIEDRLVAVNGNLNDGRFPDLADKMKLFTDSFSECSALFDEIHALLEKQGENLGILVPHLEQMQRFVAKLMEWGRVAGELTGAIHSLSVETKILSLNASIEAAKSGENAKSFGAISLDMRGKTNETAEIAEQLTTHLSSIREDVVRFAETMNAVGVRIEELRQGMVSLQPVREGQIERFRMSLVRVEDLKNAVSAFIENNEALRLQMAALPDDVRNAMENCSALEQPVGDAERSVEEFNSSLPTYEEDKESAEG